MSLIDRNFLITTGITAVICGALYYYFNSRIRDLEYALAKQNQVLSSFIVNVQQELMAGGGKRNNTSVSVSVSDNISNSNSNSNSTSDELASPEAIQAVAELKKNNKIVISDSDAESVSDSDSVSDNDNDSVSDNDGVSDSDSVSDNDSDSDDESNHQKVVICDLSLNSVPINAVTLSSLTGSEEGKHDVKVVEMSLADLNGDMHHKTMNMASFLNMTGLHMYSGNMSSSNTSTSNLKLADIEVISDDSDESESDSNDDFEHVSLNMLESMLQVEVEEIKVEEVNKTQVQEVNKVQVKEVNKVQDVNKVQVQDVNKVQPQEDKSRLEDLKVDDLRKMALDKGLVKKEEAKKLKKNELLALLKKHS